MVDVEVIPAPHQRRGQLTVGGDDQVPVIAPAEPLGLALAAAVYPQLVKQVRPVAGPVARHAGDADPPAARAAHPHHGPGPARRPGASFRRAPPPAPAAPRPPRPARPCPTAALPPGDPQVVSDLADPVATGEPPGCLQPQPFTPLLLGGRIPAPLRIPHTSVICPQAADVTTRSLRVHLG